MRNINQCYLVVLQKEFVFLLTDQLLRFGLRKRGHLCVDETLLPYPLHVERHRSAVDDQV